MSKTTESNDGPPNDRSTPASFVTDHLPLAGYLASQGHQPALIQTGSARVLFAFEQTAMLSADVAAFNDGTGRVGPAAYDAARISLRRQMDALKGGER
jgi:hypothetical protein